MIESLPQLTRDAMSCPKLSVGRKSTLVAEKLSSEWASPRIPIQGMIRLMVSVRLVTLNET